MPVMRYLNLVYGSDRWNIVRGFESIAMAVFGGRRWMCCSAGGGVLGEDWVFSY